MRVCVASHLYLSWKRRQCNFRRCLAVENRSWTGLTKVWSFVTTWHRVFQARYPYQTIVCDSSIGQTYQLVVVKIWRMKSLFSPLRWKKTNQFLRPRSADKGFTNHESSGFHLIEKDYILAFNATLLVRKHDSLAVSSLSISSKSVI